MGRKYIFHDSRELYFVSFATVNWIDVFTRKLYFEIIVDSLVYCSKNKGLELYAWCIMPSHVHLIISSENNSLSDIMRDLKRHTSKALLKAIAENPKESRKEWMLWMFGRAGKRNTNNEKFQFWQQSNHPIELSNAKMLIQRLEYLHQNPVKAGLVVLPEHYQYSSAIDYAGGQEVIPIIFAT
jgi:REP element-mobilizing transposase RayT